MALSCTRFAENWRYLKENPLEVTGDILVLAGDIGYLGDDNYCKHPFWDWASENYELVIACMGNHEFYKYFDVHSLGDGYTMEIRPNVHSYYNAVVHIADVNIIVSTLWASISPENAYRTEYGVADLHNLGCTRPSASKACMALVGTIFPSNYV